MAAQGVDGSVVIEITADETDFDKKVNKVESAAKAAGAAIGVSFAAASAAVAKISEEAVKAYSDYEQLIGGVETLFVCCSRAEMSAKGGIMQGVIFLLMPLEEQWKNSRRNVLLLH